METKAFRADIDDYTGRVLGVVKEKYGLRDKGEALNKFVHIYGDEYVDKEVKDSIVAEMIEAAKQWEKKHKFKRKMSLKELDALSGL